MSKHEQMIFFLLSKNDQGSVETFPRLYWGQEEIFDRTGLNSCCKLGISSFAVTSTWRYLLL